MKFLIYNPEQVYLLPPSVREVLGEDHICFFVHQVVERLDLSAFEQGYVEEGRPAYHPALLLKVWLYAYALGVTSARRLEQRIREDLAFRYLAGGVATYALAIRPVNGLAGNVTFACSGAPRGATCTVEPSSITLDGASIAQVKVRVATAGRAGALPTVGVD